MKSKKDKHPDHTQEDRERNDTLNKSEKNQEERLPGNYPAREDIMNRMNTERVAIDVENFSRNTGVENNNRRKEPVNATPSDIQDDSGITGDDIEDRGGNRSMERPVPRDNGTEDADGQERSESDVTDEDLQALGPKDLSMDMGEDEQLLKNRVWPVDMAGSDLDIPGSELDDDNEAVGSEDEENNSYSIGGDRHEDNMEGK